MYCSKCGNELKEDVLFCNKCGNKIENSNEQEISEIEEREQESTIISNEYTEATEQTKSDKRKESLKSVIQPVVILDIMVFLFIMAAQLVSGEFTLGVPMRIMFIVTVFALPIVILGYIGLMKTHVYFGKCPYCKTDLRIENEVTDCPMCKNRIIVKESKFYKINKV